MSGASCDRGEAAGAVCVSEGPWRGNAALEAGGCLELLSRRVGRNSPRAGDGFGTTYFGGNRDPGPFDLDAAKSKPWESQFGLIKKLFTGFDWWTLEPHDELVAAGARRGSDGKRLERLAPPETTYWALATPGQRYIVYVRGLAEAVSIDLENGRELRARQFDPRTGAFTDLPAPAAGPYRYQPPDRQDWVLLVFSRNQALY